MVDPFLDADHLRGAEATAMAARMLPSGWIPTTEKHSNDVRRFLEQRTCSKDALGV